jgi:hypothetical protein
MLSKSPLLFTDFSPASLGIFKNLSVQDKDAFIRTHKGVWENQDEFYKSALSQEFGVKWEAIKAELTNMGIALPRPKILHHLYQLLSEISLPLDSEENRQFPQHIPFELVKKVGALANLKMFECLLSFPEVQKYCDNTPYLSWAQLTQLIRQEPVMLNLTSDHFTDYDHLDNFYLADQRDRDLIRIALSLGAKVDSTIEGTLNNLLNFHVDESYEGEPGEIENAIKLIECFAPFYLNKGSIYGFIGRLFINNPLSGDEQALFRKLCSWYPHVINDYLIARLEHGADKDINLSYDSSEAIQLLRYGAQPNLEVYECAKQGDERAFLDLLAEKQPELIKAFEAEITARKASQPERPTPSAFFRSASHSGESSHNLTQIQP